MNFEKYIAEELRKGEVCNEQEDNSWRNLFNTQMPLCEKVEKVLNSEGITFRVKRVTMKDVELYEDFNKADRNTTHKIKRFLKKSKNISRLEEETFPLIIAEKDGKQVVLCGKSRAIAVASYQQKFPSECDGKCNAWILSKIPKPSIVAFLIGLTFVKDFSSPLSISEINNASREILLNKSSIYYENGTQRDKLAQKFLNDLFKTTSVLKRCRYLKLFTNNHWNKIYLHVKEWFITDDEFWRIACEKYMMNPNKIVEYICSLTQESYNFTKSLQDLKNIEWSCEKILKHLNLWDNGLKNEEGHANYIYKNSQNSSCDPKMAKNVIQHWLSANIKLYFSDVKTYKTPIDGLNYLNNLFINFTRTSRNVFQFSKCEQSECFLCKEDIISAGILEATVKSDNILSAAFAVFVMFKNQNFSCLTVKEKYPFVFPFLTVESDGNIGFNVHKIWNEGNVKEYKWPENAAQLLFGNFTGENSKETLQRRESSDSNSLASKCKSNDICQNFGKMDLGESDITLSASDHSDNQFLGSNVSKTSSGTSVESKVFPNRGFHTNDNNAFDDRQEWQQNTNIFIPPEYNDAPFQSSKSNRKFVKYEERLHGENIINDRKLPFNSSMSRQYTPQNNFASSQNYQTPMQQPNFPPQSPYNNDNNRNLFHSSNHSQKNMQFRNSNQSQFYHSNSQNFDPNYYQPTEYGFHSNRQNSSKQSLQNIPNTFTTSMQYPTYGNSIPQHYNQSYHQANVRGSYSGLASSRGVYHNPANASPTRLYNSSYNQQNFNGSASSSSSSKRRQKNGNTSRSNVKKSSNKN